MQRQILRALASSMLTLMLTASGSARADSWPGDCHCLQHGPSSSYLGAGIVSTSVLRHGERGFLQEGKGFRLMVGERLSQHFALELNWQRSNHPLTPNGPHLPSRGLALNAFALDLKIYLSGRGWIQGYLVGGTGAYLLGNGKGFFMSGLGLQCGVGADVWISPRVKVGLQAQYRGASLADRVTPDRKLSLSTVTGLIDIAIQL